jgi:hypothetical protein
MLENQLNVQLMNMCSQSEALKARRLTKKEEIRVNEREAIGTEGDIN